MQQLCNKTVADKKEDATNVQQTCNNQNPMKSVARHCNVADIIFFSINIYKYRRGEEKKEKYI
jgi:hypothetical protein